jgi:hypothetical protein
LEFLGSLPDLRLDTLLLLSRAQTPERPLGILCCPSIIIDLVQEGRVELSLGVDRCWRFPSLSASGTFFLFSFVWQGSSRCRDPAPLISRWRKSQNGRLDFFTLSWLRWHWGVVFSFVSVFGVGLVTTERGLEVVLFFVVFEDGNEVVEIKVLRFGVVEVIEETVSNDLVKWTRLSKRNGLTVFD